MDPRSLCYSREPREPVSMTRFRNLRFKLQAVANRVDDDGEIYVNGETFNADDFRFILTCLKPPTDKV